MEEPAKDAYEMLQQRMSKLSVAAHCMQKYGSELDEARKFTNTIHDAINGSRKITARANHPIWTVDAETVKQTKSPCHSLKKYAISTTVFSIEYETAGIEDTVHPLFSVYEVKNDVPKKEFKLGWYKNRLALTVAGAHSKIWVSTNMEFIKGRLFMEIINSVYTKNEQNWMAVTNGAAVSNNTGSIVLCDPGGGNRAFTALLALEGLKIIADEIVPIDAEAQRVYPFPAATSVTKSTWDELLPYFPDLVKAKSYGKANREVKYLHLTKTGTADAMAPSKIKAIVFLENNPGVEFSAIRAGRIETIRKFNEGTWIQPTRANSDIYLNWITKIRAYNLSYSNKQKAVEFVSFLLDSL